MAALVSSRAAANWSRSAASRPGGPASPPATAIPALLVGPGRSRRQDTVYTCTECDQRYLGQQWCPDCCRPCTRTGTGGLCPACDHPVTLDDLIAQHENQPTQNSKIR